VGYAIRSKTPDAAFTAKLIFITRKNFSNSESGIFGANPTTRRSMATFVPARNPIPTVCRIRTNGKAHSEGDSRSQTLGAVASIHARLEYMCDKVSFLDSR